MGYTAFDRGVRGKGFHVDDGRHRLEMYRQMGITHAPAALWTTGELLESRLIKLLENCR